MLVEYLERAIQTGGDALEIEHRDSQEWITVFKGAFGIGLGSLPSDEADPLFEEMKALKKSRRIVVNGKTYRLRFTEYESFGEWVHRIEIIPVADKAKD